MGRGDLTDAQWYRLAPLLPAQRLSLGRPSKDHRTIINGILWVVRTGAPWRDLPERYGPWPAVASRFYRWREKGVVAATPGAVAAAGRCHWRVGVGSTFCGWHRGPGPSTRRWSQKGSGDQALGRSQGGFGTKVHLRVEGKGKPVAFVLTRGQQHEARVFEELMTLGWVQRNGRGHPRIRPQRVCGDKGYSSREDSLLSLSAGHSLHHPPENE